MSKGNRKPKETVGLKYPGQEIGSRYKEDADLMVTGQNYLGRPNGKKDLLHVLSGLTKDEAVQLLKTTLAELEK